MEDGLGVLETLTRATVHRDGQEVIVSISVSIG